MPDTSMHCFWKDVYFKTFAQTLSLKNTYFSYFFLIQIHFSFFLCKMIVDWKKDLDIFTI